MHDGLLFLSHRIPYPPDKGDKIRSFHILQHLARRYRVYLGAFIDDPQDWAHVDAMREICADCCFIPLHPLKARISSLRALFSGLPLSVVYFGDRRLQLWSRKIVDDFGVRRIFIFSSQMAQYVLDPHFASRTTRVLDLVDVDSDKWAQYSRKSAWPKSALFAREGTALLRFERRVAALFDASLFVSRAEAELFRQLAPECADRVTHMDNGVNAEFFSPQRDYPDPYEGNREVIVFTGAMDYWANVDAVQWFATEIFPGIRERFARARFCIVGARPTEAVERLARQVGVTVTGRVEDVRPYLAHAKVSVAPLRLARGVQNKVLEAMAMARPVVASPGAMDGLELGEAYPLLAREPSEWIAMIAKLLPENTNEIGERMRSVVLERYAWQGKLTVLERLLEGASRTKSETGCNRLASPEKEPN